MPWRWIAVQAALSRMRRVARRMAPARGAASTGVNWKPVAAPAFSAAMLASITVSARPPVRATIGTQP